MRGIMGLAQAPKIVLPFPLYMMAASVAVDEPARESTLCARVRDAVVFEKQMIAEKSFGCEPSIVSS